MERGELRGAVARAIAEAMYATEAEEQVEVREAAAVAIRVVLAEAQRSIEALEPRADAAHFAGPLCIYRRDALAALSALVPPPPV